MNRRMFIVGVGAFVANPLAAGAQQLGKVYRVGLVFTTSPVSDIAGSEPRTYLKTVVAVNTST
jgi:hypothetical protein